MQTNEISNDDLLKYEQRFYELIGKDIIKGNYSIHRNLPLYISHVTVTSCPAAHSQAVHQAYILYTICINLMEYRQYFNINADFYTCLYLPYIYHLMSTELKAFRKMVIQLEKKSYEHIKEKASTIIDFSLVLYNISPDIIKSDTQQIFFKTTFIEFSPIELERASDYFFSSFQYIYYNYIKSKTNGMIPDDSLSSVKSVIYAKNESRYSIYEHGLRSYQIQRICSKSDTLKTISENFEELKTSVMSNQLLLILKSAYFPNMIDEKALLLKVNSSEFNIVSLEEEVPLICRLLRAIHIKSKNKMKLEDSAIMYIQQHIYTTVDNWMGSRLCKDHSQEISAALSISLSKSLLSGIYIDPRTLEVIEFKGSIFARQFQKFIILMLEKAVGGET